MSHNNAATRQLAWQSHLVLLWMSQHRSHDCVTWHTCGYVYKPMDRPQDKPTHLALIMPSTLSIRLRVYVERAKTSPINVLQYRRDVDRLRVWDWWAMHLLCHRLDKSAYSCCICFTKAHASQRPSPSFWSGRPSKVSPSPRPLLPVPFDGCQSTGFCRSCNIHGHWQESLVRRVCRQLHP